MDVIPSRRGLVGMHRVLAVLIVLLLAGGVVAAVVKSGEEGRPVVQPTFSGSPSQSPFTSGAKPAETMSETPSEAPSESASEEPSASPSELARTGGGSLVPPAFVSLGIALVAGLAIARTRGSTA
jgi:hypothetical protein